jgi:predicted Ser/Thr protein kinase
MSEKRLKEVVFLPDDVIRIDPDKFERKEITLDEYLELFQQYPSLGFDAYQRLYAALRMFGTEESTKPWKPKRWKFLDDRIESPWKRAGATSPFEIYLYGIEEPVNEIMRYLEEASINRDAQSRFFILIGPPSSAKTDLINVMSYTLDGFGTLPEGELYTVKFNLEEVSQLFYGLEEVICPAHENPLNFVPRDKVISLLKKVNEEVHPDYKWREIKFTYWRCPSCQYIIQKLKRHGISWEDKISVVNLLPQVDVAAEEFRPTAEKAYDPAKIFGGSINMSRFAKVLSKDHPLVLNFGIGGTIDGPSPQHHIVHFSEMYKAHEVGLLDEVLDLISSRNLKVGGKYDVVIDSVIFGTTNLEEYGKISSLPRLGEYLKSRSYKIPMGYILIMDDLAKALKKRVFEKMSKSRNVHVPPHYVERFLAPLGVLSTLDLPESEMKITLVQKALIYNGEVPYGLERELEEIREELRRAARAKPMEELTEGIKYGIPFRFFQELPAKLMLALDKIPEKAKAEISDPRYKGCLSMINIKNFYDEIIRTYDGINSETRRRIVDMRTPTEKNEPVELALDESYELYIQSIIMDVNKAILGEERILNLALKYLAQVYESELGRMEYRDPSGRITPIDYKFLEDVEKAAGVTNKSEFRKHFANHVKYRLSDFKSEKYPMKELAASLLKEDSLFRRAIENYAMENVLPSMIEDVSLAYSPANEPVMQELYKLGYCKACASIALQIAALRRKEKNR